MNEPVGSSALLSSIVDLASSHPPASRQEQRRAVTLAARYPHLESPHTQGSKGREHAEEHRNAMDKRSPPQELALDHLGSFNVLEVTSSAKDACKQDTLCRITTTRMRVMQVQERPRVPIWLAGDRSIDADKKYPAITLVTQGKQFMPLER